MAEEKKPHGQMCVLYDRECIGCMECETCDLAPNKICPLLLGKTAASGWIPRHSGFVRRGTKFYRQRALLSREERQNQPCTVRIYPVRSR